MVKVACVMPWRDGDERREILQGFVVGWVLENHIWDVRFGTSPDGPFNRGAAINEAAVSAEDWDVLVVYDADNICDPFMLRDAVQHADITGQVTYPYETYIYLDEYSSNRIMFGGNWFASPEVHPTQTFRTTVRHKHYSGIQVIPRSAYDAVGGYIELPGWGAEDAIMDILFDTFAAGSHWLHGAAYHLWHEAKRNDPKDIHNVANHDVLFKLKRMMEMNRIDPQQAARIAMSRAGHRIP